MSKMIHTLNQTHLHENHESLSKESQRDSSAGFRPLEGKVFSREKMGAESWTSSKFKVESGLVLEADRRAPVKTLSRLRSGDTVNEIACEKPPEHTMGRVSFFSLNKVNALQLRVSGKLEIGGQAVGDVEAYTFRGEVRRMDRVEHKCGVRHSDSMHLSLRSSKSAPLWCAQAEKPDTIQGR